MLSNDKTEEEEDEMIYLGTFGMSMLFTYFATRLKKKNKKLIIFFSFLAIFFPALLAGLRASSIGTDVNYYMLDNFKVAGYTTSFKKYMSMIYAKEPLYLVIVFTIKKIFDNQQILLFTFSFLTILCVYLGAWKWKNYLSMPVFMLVYYFLYYNDSLNIVRQHLAMAVIFLGIKYLINGKYKKYICFVIVASLIHTAAAVGVVFIFCHWYILGNKKRKRRKYAKIKEFIVLVGSGIAVCGVRLWIILAVKIGIINSRYLYYFAHSSVSNNMTDTLIYLLEIIIIISIMKQLKKRVFGFPYLKINAYLNIIFLQLANIMNYGHRLSLYFGLVNIALIAQIPRADKNRNTRIVITLIMILTFLAYWIYVYCIGGVSNTYPYQFFFNE